MNINTQINTDRQKFCKLSHRWHTHRYPRHMCCPCTLRGSYSWTCHWRGLCHIELPSCMGYWCRHHQCDTANLENIKNVTTTDLRWFYIVVWKIIILEMHYFTVKTCCLCCWDLVLVIFPHDWSDQVSKSNFLGHVVVFTDQSCREGSCKRRKPRGRCKWSQQCRAQLRSHQCFQSSQGRSSRSHIHSCSRCVCYCTCLRSDRCWAAVCIHPRHRCKTDL